MRTLLTAVTAASIFASCGRQPNEVSHTKLEISVPPEQVNAQGVFDLLTTLTSIAPNSGRGTLTLKQFLAVIPFTDTEFASVDQKRDDSASVTCTNNICVATNAGQAQEIDVSQMNLPSIGRPHVGIADIVKLKYRITDGKHLDICSIDGFSVKKLFIWSQVYAAKVTLDASNKASEASMIASPTTYSPCN